MNRSDTSPNIPLPKSWPKYIKSAMLYVIALAHPNAEFGMWNAESQAPRPKSQVHSQGRTDGEDPGE